MRRALSILSVVLFLTLSAIPAAHAKPSEAIIGYHTVRSGETLFCIGRAYGVDPWAIACANGIVNPSLIQPGQVLAIPDDYAALSCGPICTRQFPDTSPPACSCAHHHTVVCGDNLYRISLRYGVSMWRIAECNGIVNLNHIRTGDTLCIPGH